MRLFISFASFGLLNNVLYVIILSAALDLVPPSTPKGVVAFFNIFPAVLAKTVFPLWSKGQIRYTTRVAFCAATSWLGIVIVALSSSVPPRLLGISLASLSSGFGELTFLQMTTTLPTDKASKTALGAWASGTGLAGVAGAAIWWMLRGLGVRGGLGISSILPLLFPVVYNFVLPSSTDLTSKVAYQPLPTSLNVSSSPTVSTPAVPLIESSLPKLRKDRLHLSTRDKLELVKPLLLRYMLPLCLVYVEEYVINSGVAPTLVFPIPTQGIWSAFFHTPRDYYPFWSLTYQTFVFISRSSLSLGFPPVPQSYLPLPTLIQFAILLLLSVQSSHFIFASPAYTPPAPPPHTGVDRSITIVFMLICLEGLCGGSAYVNTFYHVGRISSTNIPAHESQSEVEVDDDTGNGLLPLPTGDGEENGCVAEAGCMEDEKEKRWKMEREFRIGVTGAADSFGILLAGLIAMPVEMALCDAQVIKGRTTCREL
ncbi:protein BTN1 [Tremella mesenterica]|uniref:Protein BTN n=1 Tax=Tremella mesenterica TaxID=5217 RepID=A0A4Q1BK89_TREME|nr:protein BTN1 [Tremella mesenterica]